jgi:lysozyme family protein
MNLTEANALRWARAKLTRGPEFTPVARRLIASRSRYQGISNKTGVPWFAVAVIHEREADGDWKANLAQGDPFDRVSVHVPKGRGPFNTFEDAAYDALVLCPPFAAGNKDWSPGGTLALLERYNGLGYANKGLPSPYIWAGTDQYQKGKYVADGVFDPNAVDHQLGCAGLLLAMSAFAEVTPLPPAPSPIPVPAPKTHTLIELILSLFRR